MTDTNSIIKLTAAEIAEKIASGELTAVEVTEAHLARIEAVDEKVHAFLYVDREGALAQARAVDEKRARGEKLGPLAGVPLALKDIIQAVQDKVAEQNAENKYADLWFAWSKFSR